MGILKELAERGELDSAITVQIEKVFEDDRGGTDLEETALFQCPVCGYIYEGDELPYDYVCPVCKQPGHQFFRVK